MDGIWRWSADRQINGSGFGRFATIPASRLRSSNIMTKKAIVQTHEPGTEHTDKRSTCIFLCQPSSAMEVLAGSVLLRRSQIQVSSSVRSRKLPEAESGTESAHGSHLPSTTRHSRKPRTGEPNKNLRPATKMQTNRLPPQSRQKGGIDEQIRSRSRRRKQPNAEPPPSVRPP